MLLGIAAMWLWPTVVIGTAGSVTAAVRDMGTMGAVAFTILQAFIAMSGILPASLLGVAAGAFFGLVSGFLLTAVSTMVGAVLAFLLSRSSLRPAIERMTQRRPRLAELDAALAGDGWKLVCLLRIYAQAGATRSPHVDSACNWITRDLRSMVVYDTLFKSFLRPVSLLSIAGAVIAVVFRHDLAGDADFILLWAAPVVARSSGAAFVYDIPGFHAAEVTLGMPAGSFLPFPYPPTFLALLWPLGSLPIKIAFAVFMVSTFLLYLIASSNRWGWLPFTGLNPAALVNFLAGQSGFLSAGLMLGAARLLTKHPGAAGVLFGLLTYKPQLGLMVPIALLAARQWTCIVSATLTLVFIIVSTSCWFGVEAWVACWKSFGDYGGAMEALSYINAERSTVWAMARDMGAGYNLAVACQLAAALLSTAAVWASWRRFDPCDPYPAIVVLCSGTLLVTPHAFWYDMTMLSGALILYALDREASLRLWQKRLILTGITLPSIAFLPLVAHVAPFIMVAVLWMASTTRGRDALAHRHNIWHITWDAQRSMIRKALMLNLRAGRGS